MTRSPVMVTMSPRSTTALEDCHAEGLSPKRREMEPSKVVQLEMSSLPAGEEME